MVTHPSERLPAGNQWNSCDSRTCEPGISVGNAEEFPGCEVEDVEGDEQRWQPRVMDRVFQGHPLAEQDHRRRPTTVQNIEQSPCR